MHKTTTEALAARLDVLSVALQDVARVLALEPGAPPRVMMSRRAGHAYPSYPHEGLAAMTTACQCQALTEDLLDSYLGKAIDVVCPHGYTDSSLNHCAHFVCHVMSIAVGAVSCRGQAAHPTAGRMGVCIRVHELFSACPLVGEVVACGPDTFGDGRFVFVTARNVVDVRAHRMSNVPRKHVGIGIGNTIWHYSNTQDQVVKTTPEQFIHHYRGQTNGLFWGSIPGHATPVRHGCAL